MAKSKYMCSQCGRMSNLPDYCCGQAMVQKGSYICRSCGANSQNPGNCCSQPMEQL